MELSVNTSGFVASLVLILVFNPDDQLFEVESPVRRWLLPWLRQRGLSPCAFGSVCVCRVEETGRWPGRVKSERICEEFLNLRGDVESGGLSQLMLLCVLFTLHKVCQAVRGLRTLTVDLICLRQIIQQPKRMTFLPTMSTDVHQMWKELKV